MGACHPPPIVVSRTPPPIDSVWPSFLEQLSLCPLSVWFTRKAIPTGRLRPSGPAAIVGKAVHRCIELMVTNEALNLKNCWESACDEISLTDGDPRELPNANRSYLRLEKKYPQLEELIRDRLKGGDLIPEESLTAHNGLLRGQPDLIINGPAATLIDYKSGSVIENGIVQPKYENQLLFYAYLIQKSISLDVNEAWLFSLIDGLIKVDVSVDKRDAYIEKGKRSILSFNENLPKAPSGCPSKNACKWCTHINTCDVVWESLDNNEIKDFDSYHMVEGVITNAPERTNNGKSTVSISVNRGTASGEIVISSIPRNLAETIQTDSTIRISRLKKEPRGVATFSWKDGASTLSVQD